MFAVPRGEIVLGQATLVIDDIHGHREKKVDMIAAGTFAARIARRMLKWIMKRFGYLGLVAFAAHLAATNPAFDIVKHFPMVMGAITSAVCSSFKVNLGLGIHDFTITTGNTVKAALYTSSATLGASTTAYSATNEISGTGYSAGGVAMANVTPVLSSTTAIYDWADAEWTTASFTANGCLVYDDTAASNQSIFVIAFGGDQTVTVGTFAIQWPTADASNAIIRIA